ncbi:hypothetical protein DXV75_14530 [Alteromonas aestuariivivens]|uniref:Uncharacterized protein n=1 Tax=Alteromonas aestuariivivens TaxID=1938339 RepID=A0A3D8M3V7_9ALTE|nr:hypothetical protein [Alteromonas aestuariivivens]RDV24427.1 hypothetical protein DXV75_14530 [Alteromonas aestuariivivens]
MDTLCELRNKALVSREEKLSIEKEIAILKFILRLPMTVEERELVREVGNIPFYIFQTLRSNNNFTLENINSNLNNPMGTQFEDSEDFIELALCDGVP